MHIFRQRSQHCGTENAALSVVHACSLPPRPILDNTVRDDDGVGRRRFYSTSLLGLGAAYLMSKFALKLGA